MFYSFLPTNGVLKIKIFLPFVVYRHLQYLGFSKSLLSNWIHSTSPSSGISIMHIRLSTVVRRAPVSGIRNILAAPTLQCEQGAYIFISQRRICHNSIFQASPTWEGNKLTNVRIDWSCGRATAEFPVSVSKVPQLQGHFPGRPVLPAVITLQAMVDLAVILNSSFSSKVFGQTTPMFPLTKCFSPVSKLLKASFRHPVYPSHRSLLITVDRMKSENDSSIFFSASATLHFVESRPIAAEARFMLRQLPS